MALSALQRTSIANWFAAVPDATAVQIAQAMNTVGLTAEDMAEYSGASAAEIAANAIAAGVPVRYSGVIPATTQMAAWLRVHPAAADPAATLREANRLGITYSQLQSLTGYSAADIAAAGLATGVYLTADAKIATAIAPTLGGDSAGHAVVQSIAPDLNRLADLAQTNSPAVVAALTQVNAPAATIAQIAAIAAAPVAVYSSGNTVAGAPITVQGSVPVTVTAPRQQFDIAPIATNVDTAALPKADAVMTATNQAQSPAMGLISIAAILAAVLA